MSKFIIILSILLIHSALIGQVDFKKLKESAPIEFTSQMSIYEYTFKGELYTGNTSHKNLFGETKCHFKNGKKHGLESSLYKNGNQKEELEYENGVLLHHKKWSKDGLLEFETIYKKGYYKSRKTYHSSGQIDTEEKFRRKGSIAKQIQYDKNERLESKGKLIIDTSGRKEKTEKTGRWKYYNNKGELKKKEKWRNGKLISKRKK